MTDSEIIQWLEKQKRASRNEVYSVVIKRFLELAKEK